MTPPLGRAERLQLHAGQSITSLIVRRATKPVRIWASERGVTYQNRAFAFSIGVPTPRVIVESVDVVPTPRVIAESVDVHRLVQS